jgi:hypothetical protein
MGLEDKRISRLLEHELYRFQSLDISDARIQVTHGVGYVGGVIRPAAGLYYLNMKEELRVVTESTRKIPGLRDLVIDAKIEQSPKR